MKTAEEDSVIGEGTIYYGDLKAVRSIWICMDSANDADFINRIRFTQENVYENR